jgi:hypothetical protein
MSADVDSELSNPDEAAAAVAEASQTRLASVTRSSSTENPPPPYLVGRIAGLHETMSSLSTRGPRRRRGRREAWRAPRAGSGPAVP